MFLEGAAVVRQAASTSVGEKCVLRGELFFFCVFFLKKVQ